ANGTRDAYPQTTFRRRSEPGHRATHGPANPSALDLPRGLDLTRGRILGVLELDAHGGEFVADAVGLLEVPSLARRVAGFDQRRDLVLVDGEGGGTPSLPRIRRQLQQTHELSRRLEARGCRL